MSDKTYNLSDAAIAQVAKVLQIAILTGTDITDNLRLMKFIGKDSSLVLEPGYEEAFNKNLEKMMSNVNAEVQAEETNEPQ